MPRIIRIVITLAVILGSGCCYIYMTNMNYFSAERENYSPYKWDRVEVINLKKLENNQYLTEEDSQFVLKWINGYITHIRLAGIDNIENMEPRVYYTNKDVVAYSEENSFEPEYYVEGDALILVINQYVSGLRIDLTENAGVQFRLDNIYIKPTVFQVDFLGLFIAVNLSCVLLFPLYFKSTIFKRVYSSLVIFKNYIYLLSNLVKKDFTLKYRRSILGVLWSILNPLLMMLVLTAVFQRLFRFSIENFPLYYLTGYLIFSFTIESTTAAMMSIVGASSLIKKVYIPKYIFPLQNCIFSFINMLFSLIAVIVVFVVLQVVPPATIFLFPIPMLYVFFFSVGLGMLLATLNVFFRDTAHLYSVMVTAWLYLTPIIYPVEILPSQVLAVVKINPLYYYVQYFRDIAFYGVLPDLKLNLICGFFSLYFLAIGILVFKRNQDKFILFI